MAVSKIHQKRLESLYQRVKKKKDKKQKTERKRSVFKFHVLARRNSHYAGWDFLPLIFDSNFDAEAHIEGFCRGLLLRTWYENGRKIYGNKSAPSEYSVFVVDSFPAFCEFENHSWFVGALRESLSRQEKAQAFITSWWPEACKDYTPESVCRKAKIRLKNKYIECMAPLGYTGEQSDHLWEQYLRG